VVFAWFEALCIFAVEATTVYSLDSQVTESQQDWIHTGPV